MTAYIYTKDNKRVITIKDVVTIFQMLENIIIHDVNGVVYTYNKNKFKITLFTE